MRFFANVKRQISITGREYSALRDFNNLCDLFLRQASRRGYLRTVFGSTAKILDEIERLEESLARLLQGKWSCIPFATSGIRVDGMGRVASSDFRSIRAFTRYQEDISGPINDRNPSFGGTLKNMFLGLPKAHRTFFKDKGNWSQEPH